MPTELTPFALLVWTCVGLFTGFGWATGTWVVNRLFR